MRVNLAQYDKGDKPHSNVTSNDPNFNHPMGLNAFNPAVPQLAVGSQSHSALAIAALLKSLSKSQLLEVLNETQKFINANPEGSRQLLIDNPQLTLAILHIQIMFGLIRPEDVQTVLQQQTQSNNIPFPMGIPAQMPLPPPTHPTAAPSHLIPPPSLPQPSSHPPQFHTPMPIPPPIQSQPQPQPPPHSGIAPNEFGITMSQISHLPIVEQNAIMEIVKLKPEDIQKLPPQEQQTVISLLQKVKR